jgi:hypothetical protein
MTSAVDAKEGQTTFADSSRGRANLPTGSHCGRFLMDILPFRVSSRIKLDSTSPGELESPGFIAVPNLRKENTEN